MRLRHIAKAIPIIEESKFVEHAPKEWKGRWRERFGNENPVHIEVGMGKGKFITTLAALHPEINYVGIERADSVLFRALQKQQELKLPNLILLLLNADELALVFAPGEVDRIYLNFSDPWPKDRQEKRRLTSKRYFAIYRQILSAEGRIEFKTDNEGLFDYSLGSAPACGWTVLDVTRDLHHSEYSAENVMTEYEERFSGMGNPIYKAVFRFPGTGE